MEPDEQLPDLKHDNMEFSASTEGDDPIEIDDNPMVEEDITADELDEMDAPPEEEAIALTAAGEDLADDEDQLPTEDWTDDLDDYSEVDASDDLDDGAEDEDEDDAQDEPYPGV